MPDALFAFISWDRVKPWILVTVLILTMIFEISSIVLCTHPLIIMNSSMVSFNTTGMVTHNEEIPNAQPLVIRVMENNHCLAPLIHFTAPFRLIVAGPSQSEKTTFIQRIIREARLMIRPSPDTITWYYAHHQEWFSKWNPPLNFIKGLPDVNKLVMGKIHLIILDNLFLETNKDLVKLFTVDSPPRYQCHSYHAKLFSPESQTKRYISQWKLCSIYEKPMRPLSNN